MAQIDFKKIMEISQLLMKHKSAVKTPTDNGTIMYDLPDIAASFSKENDKIKFLSFSVDILGGNYTIYPTGRILDNKRFDFLSIDLTEEDDEDENIEVANDFHISDLYVEDEETISIIASFIQWRHFVLSKYNH